MWQPVPVGLSGVHGRVGGMGATPSGGMVPQSSHLKQNIQAKPSFCVCCLEDIALSQVTVLTKDCPHIWPCNVPY